MASQILLGPQNPASNLRQAVESLSVDGPILVITAGWRDSEGEIDDLKSELDMPVEDLMLYHRAEEVFSSEPGLRALKRERQDKLKELQKLYRIRLAPAMTAARKLLRASAEPELLRLEQRASIAQLRALDRHHLRRIVAIHKDFDERRATMRIPLATAQREAVQSKVADAGLILIAGGHVAVLLNRLRLFRLGESLAHKNIIAWSAGAMALSERIVLFHHRAPQGRRDAEILDTGLGIVRNRVLLPGAKSRLDWSNGRRLALFSRRFSPAACCTLDSGSMIHIGNGRLLSAHGSGVVMRSGRKKDLKAK